MNPIQHFFNRHVFRPDLRSRISKIVGGNDTDDALQEIAVRLLKRLRADIEHLESMSKPLQVVALDVWVKNMSSHFKPINDLTPIIIRLAKDFRSDHVSRKPCPNSELMDSLCKHSHDDPFENASCAETEQMILRFAGTLPRKQRWTVKQILAGRTTREIADTTGQPLGTVHSQWFFGRRTLQQRLRHLRKFL